MPESKRRKPKRPTRSPISSGAAEAKAKGPSPSWYVFLMAGLLGLGLLAVLARFIFQWPQYFLFGGFAMIAGGFIMATNYR